MKELKLRIAASAPIKSKTEFILDSGTLQHISNDLRRFTSLESIEPISVHLAEDRILQAKRQGSVLVNLYLEHSDGQTAIKFMLT